ncbi:MAG: type IV secretion system protein VirB10 [Alphaproteobacteria bacterium]
MSNNNDGDIFDENTGEILIEGDRGAPTVAKNGAGRIIMMVVFGLVCLLAFVAVIYDGMTKNNTTPTTEKEEIVFNAPKPRTQPYIVDSPEPPQEALSSPQAPQIDPELLRRQQQLMADALRRAQEQQAKLEERLKSPQLVYDQKTQNSAQVNFSNQQTDNQNGGATLLSGGSNNDDPNLAFAKANTNTNVQTAKATQLQNMDTLIAQGKMISGILETAIQSDLPGMVRAISSEDVYSFNGSTLLIPKGSRLVGQYRSGVRQGQSRVFVIWNRMIRPDGASVDLGSIGTDSLGRSGLTGEVDSHFMERFGSSVLLSIIDGALSAAVNKIDDDDASTVSLSGSGDFSRSSEIALENSINIKPTIHIDQGERIKIFVGKDLDFSGVGGVPR